MVGEHTVNPEAQECRVFTQWIAERPRPRYRAGAPAAGRRSRSETSRRGPRARRRGPARPDPRGATGGPMATASPCGGRAPARTSIPPAAPAVSAGRRRSRRVAPAAAWSARRGREACWRRRTGCTPGAAGPARRRDREQRALVPQADGSEVRRLFDLRVHADRAAPPPRLGENKVEDVVERRDLELLVVEPVVGSEVGQALPGPQCLELGQSELLDEPSSDCRPATSFVVRRSSELRLGARRRWWLRSRSRAGRRAHRPP